MTRPKNFTGVKDTANNFFAGVNDTGDKKMLPISACIHLKMKNKQKINLQV
jgi:hypothetical protein